jgi:very-short-patch-repair endonuclease
MGRSSDIDRMIIERARRWHGVVTYGQLRAAGISDKSIQHRIMSGLLIRLHQGVYAVGHASLSELGVLAAALAATGREAAISHLTSANLWQISRIPAGNVDVVTTVRRRNRDGLTVHHTQSLPKWHTVTRDGLRRTTVARTLFDLADSLTPWQLANLMNEAHRRRRLKPDQLERFIHQWPGRIGAGRMARALRLHAEGSAGTKSNVEDVCLELLLEAGLPTPHVNVHVRFGAQSYELDFHWPHLRLNLEVDSFGHSVPMRAVRDEERNFVMNAAGWTVIRVSDELVNMRSPRVVERVRAAFAAAS